MRYYGEAGQILAYVEREGVPVAADPDFFSE